MTRDNVGRVYVVVVNWNGVADTVPCVESVLRSDYPDYQIVVCDNASSDGSPERLAAWADGREPFVGDPESPVALAPVPKPAPYARLSREEAERGGGPAGASARVVLVDVGHNAGFAGGCNVGMRYALARGDAGYVWLLNNDTVVTPAAMRALVERLRERPAAGPPAGMCGSTLYFYHRPTQLQAPGVTGFDPKSGYSVKLFTDGPPATDAEVRAVEARAGYVEGASLMVPRAFLDDVGLMSEAYFLYYEEVDWMLRVRGRWTLAYAPASVVYHKEGASTGSNRHRAVRGVVADRYLLQSRLRVTWRMNRRYLPWVVRQAMLEVRGQLQAGERRRALRSLRVLLSPRTYFGYGR